MRPKGLPPPLRRLPRDRMRDQLDGGPRHADHQPVSALASVYQQPGHRILRRLPQCTLLPHLAKVRAALEADYSSYLPIFAQSPANCLLHSLQRERMQERWPPVEAALLWSRKDRPCRAGDGFNDSGLLKDRMSVSDSLNSTRARELASRKKHASRSRWTVCISVHERRRRTTGKDAETAVAVTPRPCVRAGSACPPKSPAGRAGGGSCRSTGRACG
jgi:hypothetical protein